MEADGLVDLDGKSNSDCLSNEHDTVVMAGPAGSPSQIESALAQYADSIERMSGSSDSQLDPYTRGFVAGLRAAITVAANVINK